MSTPVRTLLVAPDTRVNRAIPDLNLVYAATYLDAAIVDLNTRPRPADRVLNQAAETLGLSVRSLARPEAVRLAAAYRRRHPAARVCSVEGPLVTQCCYPYEQLDDHLAVPVEFGDDLRFPEYERLDSFPMFRWRWALGLWRYPIMTSQGCPFGCRHCASRRTGWRARSAADCAAELLGARERWGIRAFEVLDDCFNVDRDRVLEFCVRVARLGLTWACTNGVRADLLDEATCRAMAAAGCSDLSLGIETVDPDVLAALGKGETIDDFERAIELGRRHFETVGGYFIIGLPGSSAASDRRSLEWARRRGVQPHFSYYVPGGPGGHPEAGALFYGEGATPRSPAYAAAEQQRLYAETRGARPDGLTLPARLGAVFRAVRRAARGPEPVGPDVVHVTNFLPGYHERWGGAERVCARVVAAQQRAGVDARVTCAPPRGPYRDRLAVRPLPNLADRHGGRAPVGSFDPVAVAAVAWRWWRERPRLVHLHNVNVVSPAIALVARALRVPVVWSIYDYWSVCPKETLIDAAGGTCASFHGWGCGRCHGTGLGGALKGVTRRVLLGAARACVARTVVLSQASADLMARAGVRRESLRVIHQPLDLEAIPDLTGAGDGRTILYMGWLQERKGLHVLLEALPGVLARHPDARLEVLDLEPAPGYRARLDAVIAGHGLAGHVRFHGRRPAEEARALLAAAAVVVVPEQWENMAPVVVVEAMAAGRPVVASRVGGIPEFVVDGVTGLLVDRDDPAAFTAAIERLLDDPAAAAALGAAARVAARAACDEGKINAAMLALYDEVAPRGSACPT